MIHQRKGAHIVSIINHTAHICIQYFVQLGQEAVRLIVTDKAVSSQVSVRDTVYLADVPFYVLFCRPFLHHASKTEQQLFIFFQKRYQVRPYHVNIRFPDNFLDGNGLGAVVLFGSSRLFRLLSLLRPLV